MSDMADFCNEYQDGTMEEYYDYFSGNIHIPDYEQQPHADQGLQVGSISHEGLLEEIEANHRMLAPQRGDPVDYCDGSRVVQGRRLNAAALAKEMNQSIKTRVAHRAPAGPHRRESYQGGI